MAVLDHRSLNRATPHRQLLLRSSDMSAVEVIEHLVGLQAQDPVPPDVGLWSRMRNFGIDDLEKSLHERAVVRSTLFRGTQHLVSAEDYLWLRLLLQPMSDRWQKGGFGRFTRGIDLVALAGRARVVIGTGVVARPDLGRALAGQGRGRARPFGTGSASGGPSATERPSGAARDHSVHVGRAMARAAVVRGALPQDLVLRYLASFGPATVKDIQTWSDMTRLREVVGRLRHRLLVLGGEEGADLFDLPDAPRPDPDTSAPVRFLAALDNVVLGHADRSRIMRQEQRKHVIVHAALFVDGFVHGLWKIDRTKGSVVLSVRLFESLPSTEKENVLREGGRLLRFAAGGADDHDIRFTMVQD
ncbi:winged helix DNA-binding domain-containing protein [Nocardiopsis alkaliphila]|uniref:winged helix DNA-binding domain-containing protein n=1 Tax=Nocardiopsis alkaliphila TaxID=225762 RepID=UPI00034A51A6|nr:winged helix DNA-binding domain-containing protein [Nocardiopsis alkaliphila]